MSAPRADDLRASWISTRPDLDDAALRSASLVVAEHGASPADVRDLLAVLGLIDAKPCASVADALPCGHARASLRRRPTGRGVECMACNAAAERVRYARRRKLRVAAS